MRVYATTDEGRRFLHSIRCDGPDCESEIKPNPDISQSGWVWYGQDHGPGTSRLEWDYCPECDRRRSAH